MNLNKQIYLYSVDTSAFFNTKELRLHKKLCQIYAERHKCKERKIRLTKECAKSVLANRKIEVHDFIEKLNVIIAMKTKTALLLKNRLRIMLQNNKGKFIRSLNPAFLTKKNVVAMFESISTRTFGFQTDELQAGLIIVRIYYFDVFHDIMSSGFYLGNEKYLYFTSGAGQIRTKKTMFVKETLWDKHQKSLMGGLTIDAINKCGGINASKFLSYLALCNGATERLQESASRPSLRTM